ncbi:MAG: NAD-dependent epimerase/dehydratase family protein [Myxococcota bacterium]
MAYDVLVTGGAGFIGGALLRALAGAGRRVISADLREAAHDHVHLDLARPWTFDELLAAHRPRAVVHCAALVDDRGRLEDFERINVEGSRELALACARAGVERFVQLSSIAALGYDPGPDADEATPMDLDNPTPYFQTKARSEQAVRDVAARTRLPTVVIRPGDVYGPGSVPWVERPLALLHQRLPTLLEGGRGTMAHCHVDNLVSAIALALEVPAAVGEVFIVHDGPHTSMRDYVTRLAGAAGAPAPRSMGKGVALALARAGQVASRAGVTPPMTPGAVAYLTRRATYRTDQARDVLGWAPHVGLDEGMMRLGASLRGASGGARR